uniref:Uncharacterized protein n=1 Tax=Gopherus evgoodei TaxID=1825980 RepID=A0A8C4VZ61_9SAUR
MVSDIMAIKYVNQQCFLTYTCVHFQRWHHKMTSGVDVVCNDGSTVYAPFSGTIERKVIPYKISNAINNGLQLHGSDICVKMLYIKVYPGITSHVTY